MPGNNGIDMTMDTSQFEGAINKVLKGFGMIDSTLGKISNKAKTVMSGAMSHVGNIVNKITGSFPKKEKEKTDDNGESKMQQFGAGMVAKGMLIATAITAIAGKAKDIFLGLIHGIINNIPEINKTFEIAGDIIKRNLLAPLRRELLPILQHILSWVRDHRIMFVQMGTVLVSVFRVIKTVVLSFVDTFKRIWDGIAKKIEQVFGVTTKNITEVVNLILFKMAAVVIFIQTLLEPVFDFIGKQLGNMVEYFKKFGDGVMSTMGDVMPSLISLYNSFRDVGNMLSEILGHTNAIGTAFKVLGQIIGMTIKPIIGALTIELSKLATGLDTVSTTIQLVKAKMNGNSGEADRLMKGYVERQQKRNQSFDNTVSDVTKNTVTGAGKIKDTLSGNTTIDNKQDITINISGTGNPKDTGRAVQEAILNARDRQKGKY